MKLRTLHRPAPAGFTLAEVAVTIAIVGIALTMVLQGLHSAKLTAAQTRNYRIANELGTLTLGQIESGLFWEYLDGGRYTGTYADEEFPDFEFEVVIGDETFQERADERDGMHIPYDSWYDDDPSDDDEEAEQPYEKVRLKVIFPKIQERKNELVLEKWVAWDQVHEPADDQDVGSGDEESEP